jgi:ATP-dependent Clp protease ATP-binding subunit ClpC
MERHSVARLVGAPPGYVGYEEGGQLTEAVRRKSYSVILLDEIEKAHPEVFNILLQILEDGRLTDAKGRAVDFRNTIIIMTSNVGASLLNQDARLGFKIARSSGDEEKQRQHAHEDMIKRIMNELKSTFKPEFLNRIDATIVFKSLTLPEVHEICDLMTGRIKAQLIEQQIELVVTPEAKDYLVQEGFDPTYGARPLRRTIQNLVEDPLAEGMLQGKFYPGSRIVVDRSEDGIDLRPEELPPLEPSVESLSAAEAES